MPGDSSRAVADVFWLPLCPGRECCEGETTCCAVGDVCCGDECCDEDRCCGNGECCAEECEECLDNGTLSGGTVTVVPQVVCIGQTITFTVDGVVDSGGLKRVDCSSTIDLPAVEPSYTWVITKPDSTTESGSGASANGTADQAGVYSCTFTANADRECPPADLELAPAIGTAAELVDLSFEGLAADDEDDPGGFLCVDGPAPLPALLIEADGALTNGTVEFEVVSGENLIQMYNDAAATTPVTYFNQSWPVADLPITRYVRGIEVSAAPRDVEFRLSYTGDGGPCADTMRLTVVKVDLKSLTFTSDHGVLLDKNDNFEKGGASFGEPEWDADIRPLGVPISHTMGEHVTVDVEVEISPLALPPTQFALAGTGPPGFNFADLPSLHGGQNVVLATSADTVDEQFHWFAPSITWRIERAGRLFLETEASPKLVYVTMGAPRDTGADQHQATQIRMERAVQYAGAVGSLNPHEIVAKVRDAAGTYDLNAPRLNAWEVPEKGGDCQSIIRFVEKVVKMVDVPGTFEHKHIYAIETAPAVAIEGTATDGGLNDNIRIHPTQPTWTLSLIDGTPGCNAYEATASYLECSKLRYYPGGVPLGVMANKDDVLRVFATLSWVEFVGGVCTVRAVAYTYPAVPAPPAVPNCP